jgi:hypothetical protein
MSELIELVQKAVADASPYHNDRIFLLDCEAEAAIRVIVGYIRRGDDAETAGGE